MLNNVLQQVITYQLSSLAILQNLYPFVATCNTQFNNFETFNGNLGSSVSFDSPPRMDAENSLVVTQQGVTQPVHTLTVDQPASVAYSFTAEQFIFNVSDYINKIGRSAMVRLGGKVEEFVAAKAETSTYRFYGNGRDPINSFGQLMQALSFFKEYGSANGDYKFYISNMAAPAIVNSGLNQFALDRNNELAQSWMLGTYADANFYVSNMLKRHVAGTVGNANTTLTVVSINAEGTQLTLSGATPGDTSAVLANDKGWFLYDIVGQQNINYLTYSIYSPSQCPVQFRVTANAPADGGGNVVLNVDPPLIFDPTSKERNLTTPITAGMQVKILPTRRCGLLTSGNPLYLAMPRLPATEPFPYSNAVDPNTGVSIRNYWYTQPGLNQYSYVNDCIFGSTLVDQYAMEIAFPDTVIMMA